MRVLLAGLVCLSVGLAACGENGSSAGAASPIATATPAPAPTPTPTPTPTTTLKMTSSAASPIIATISTPIGEDFKLFGIKSVTGLASTVDRIEYADGVNKISYDLGSDQRIASADTDDGSHFAFRWTDTGVEVLMTSPNGEQVSLPALTGNFSAQSSLGQRSMAAVVTHGAQASVSQCGQPADADVYFDIFDPSTAVVARSIRADRIATGKYTTAIPQDINDFDVDFSTRANAELAANILTRLCQDDRDAIAVLSNVCKAASAPGLKIPDSKLKVTCTLLKGLNSYCNLVGKAAGEELVQKIIRSLPDKTRFYRPTFNVRARAIALPTSVVSVGQNINATSFTFNLNLGTTCPKIAFSQIYNANLYWYVDNRLVAVIPPRSERVVDLRQFSPGRHSLSVFGELVRASSPGETLETAQYISFPLLIKAVSGVSLYTSNGGRIVQTPAYGTGSGIGSINLANYVYHDQPTGPRDALYYIVID